MTVASRPNRMAMTAGQLGVPATVAAAIAVVPLGLALTIERYTYDIWGAFVWGPVVVLACLPLCRWAARRTGDPDVVRFLMGAAVLKVIVGSVVRYSTAQVFYGGLADAARYDNAGSLLAPLFRRGIFDDLGAISGTRFIEVLSGVVQAVIGDTRMGTFFVFSFFGFAGMVLLYVAFCEGVPTGSRRVYRWLLFLSPTMWYWPSSIGKEAFMLLCLGAAAWGAVLLFRGRAVGLLVGGIGLWATVVVRPHVTLVFLAGLVLALPALARKTQDLSAARFLLPVAVLLALPLVINQVEQFFSIDSLDADSAQSVLDLVELRTTQGGSQFSVPDTTSPFGLVIGIATVTIRPFVWEASNVTSLLSAIEATLLATFGLWCVAARLPVLISNLRYGLPRLSLGYTLGFAVVFASVGNFGIVVRQRSLLLPFVFVLFAGAAHRHRRTTGGPSPDRALAADVEAPG